MDHHLLSVGIDITFSGDMHTVFSWLATLEGFVITTASLVVLYGFREKFRTRFDQCNHIPSCSAALIKFLVKAIIHFLVVLMTCASVAVLAFSEAVLLILLAAHEACSAGQDAVASVLELMTDNDLLDDDNPEQQTETLNEICDAVSSLCFFPTSAHLITLLTGKSE